MTETKEQRKARYIRNKDKEAEQNKQFRLKNPNYHKEYKKVYMRKRTIFNKLNLGILTYEEAKILSKKAETQEVFCVENEIRELRRK